MFMPIIVRPICYNEGQCGTRMINAKIYLEDALFNKIEEENLKQGVLKSID